LADPIQWSSFPDLSVEDTVSLEITGNGGGPQVEFQLETAPSVTWWKALEVRSASDQLLARVEMQDNDHGPRSVAVDGTLLRGARLVLAKAKLFGIHTGMYELRDLDTHLSQRLHFIWQRDDDRDGPVAGFFRDLGRGISQGANAVADVVEAIVNAVGEVVSDIIETIGTLLGNALDWLGNALSGIPVIGGILQGVFHWLAGVVHAVFDLIAAFVKAVLNIVGGVVAGIVRLIGGAIGGVLAWDGRLLVKSLGDIASSIAGPVLLFLGKVLALIQSVFGLQWAERPLTQKEHDLLQRVYRRSVALYDIRIVPGWTFFSLPNPRPFTLGNTIYLKGVNTNSNPDVLVHECGHVWQYQHEGDRYASDALYAQATVPSTYSWEAELARGHLRWQDFNKEAQAQFLQDVWNQGKIVGDPMTGNGVFYDDDPVSDLAAFAASGTDRTSLAVETVAHVRGAFVWRLSNLL
jgi:hypothetical protein